MRDNIYGTNRYPHNAAAMPTGARMKQEEMNKALATAGNAGHYKHLCERMVRAWDGENAGLQRAIVEEARALLQTGGAA